MAYTKYSLTPADNNAAPPNGAPEGMLPSAVNDTMRDMMSQIRDVGDGIRGGTYTMTAPVITGGSITGVALSGNTLTNPVITGGSINNTTVGATTANTGKFTTLEATGATTFSGAVVMSASVTANTFSSSGATITGGSINGATVGATTRATGAFTTLASNGATTFTAGTASTSTTTGTAVITGGLGVSGRINAANFDGIVGANTAAAGNFTTLGATGVATFSAGTVSLPAITTTGDTNTGIFFPAADTIAFTEGGAESMRIDSSGNVGIGVTPSTWSLGKSLEIGTVGNCLWGAASADLRLLAGSYYNSGFKYAVSSQAVAKYEISGGSHAWFTAPSGTAGNAVTFTQGMTLDASGNLLVGITSARANAGDVQVSKGISFPATQSAQSDANTLDDYEEGTFTPTINSSGGGTGTYAANGQTGVYTKVGNRVFFTIWLDWTAHSGSGTMNIGGLPFTSSTTTNLWTAVSVSSFSGGVTLSANSYLIPSIPNNSTLIALYQTATGTITPATVALDVAGQFNLSGSYQV